MGESFGKIKSRSGWHDDRSMVTAWTETSTNKNQVGENQHEIVTKITQLQREDLHVIEWYTAWHWNRSFGAATAGTATIENRNGVGIF